MRTLILSTLALSMLAAAVLAGCAAPDEHRVAREDKGDVIIGSHLPRRDSPANGVAVYGREAVEAEQSRSGGPKAKGDENPHF